MESLLFRYNSDIDLDPWPCDVISRSFGRVRLLVPFIEYG